MKLKSFGCSFIFGSDLKDSLNSKRSASNLTWPALLATHLGYSYQSFAWPGSGNLQILEKLLNQLDHDEPALYVVGWTYIDRFDFVNPAHIAPRSGTTWHTLMPTDNDHVASTYFRHLHSEYSDKFRSLIYIKTAIDALQKSESKFIMTYMDRLILCKQWHTTEATDQLGNHVRPFLKDFDGYTFLEWSRQNNFAISPAQHPLEEAHQKAAHLVIERFDSFLSS